MDNLIQLDSFGVPRFHPSFSWDITFTVDTDFTCSLNIPGVDTLYFDGVEEGIEAARRASQILEAAGYVPDINLDLLD